MGTRAPEIPLALVAIWGLLDVAVVDGPFVRGDKGAALFVGYDGEAEASDFEAVTTEREPVTIDGAFTEIVTVTCALLLHNGDGNPTELRAAIYEQFDAATNAVDGDPTLGLDGVTAHIPSSRLYLRPSSKRGLEGLLIFPLVAEVL